MKFQNRNPQIRTGQPPSSSSNLDTGKEVIMKGDWSSTRKPTCRVCEMKLESSVASSVIFQHRKRQERTLPHDTAFDKNRIEDMKAVPESKEDAARLQIKEQSFGKPAHHETSTSSKMSTHLPSKGYLVRFQKRMIMKQRNLDHAFIGLLWKTLQKLLGLGGQGWDCTFADLMVYPLDSTLGYGIPQKQYALSLATNGESYPEDVRLIKEEFAKMFWTRFNDLRFNGNSDFAPLEKRIVNCRTELRNILRTDVNAVGNISNLNAVKRKRNKLMADFQRLAKDLAKLRAKMDIDEQKMIEKQRKLERVAEELLAQNYDLEDEVLNLKLDNFELLASIKEEAQRQRQEHQKIESCYSNLVAQPGHLASNSMNTLEVAINDEDVQSLAKSDIDHISSTDMNHLAAKLPCGSEDVRYEPTSPDSDIEISQEQPLLERGNKNHLNCFLTPDQSESSSNSQEDSSSEDGIEEPSRVIRLKNSHSYSKKMYRTYEALVEIINDDSLIHWTGSKFKPKQKFANLTAMKLMKSRLEKNLDVENC